MVKNVILWKLKGEVADAGARPFTQTRLCLDFKAT